DSVASATAAAKEAGVRIDTIAFGTADGTLDRGGQSIPVPADPFAMEQIADGSGGKAFTAGTRGGRRSGYDQNRKTVGYDTQQSDLSIWFLGFGLVAGVLAAGAALVWSQRLV